MTQRIRRRDFLTATTSAGIAFCGACLLSRAPAFGEEETVGPQPTLAPKKLNYCGYTCPDDCPMLQGTLTDDVDLKKKAYDLWKIEERFGFAFDPETIFCYGCKTPDKPDGLVVGECDVRACAGQKEWDCCIQCQELVDCDKDLWRRFPKFKDQVVDMQKRYRAQS
jgi:hypothetical protein